MSVYNTAADLHPDLVAAQEALDQVAKSALAARSEQMDRVLYNLLADGITASQISLAHHPDGRVEIKVDDVPTAEFRIQVKAENT